MSVNILLRSLAIALATIVASRGAAVADHLIILNYPGTRLAVDDSIRSRDGVDTVSVGPGTHSLSLYLPAMEGVWMPPVLHRRFIPAEDETLQISPEGTTLLNVLTTPEEASVFLDGLYLDATPLSLTVVRGMDRTLRVEKEGYRSVTIDLERQAPGGSVLTLSLDPVQTETGREVPMAPGKESGRHLPGWVPYTAFSFFVVSTALGFHSRSRADELYDDYLASSSREQMDRLYDQSRTMDNRARIFWISGEIALGASIYLWAREFREHDARRTRYPLSLGLSRRSGGDVFLSVAYGAKVH